MLRNTLFEVLYEGTDITADMTPDVLSISYTDNEDGKVDEISIALKDEGKKWIGDWMPGKGDKVRLKFKPLNQLVLDCGQFEIDDVGASGPPTVMEFRASSVPIKSAIRRELKSKAWEKITLKKIATTISKGAGMELLFLLEADNDPYYQREDQTEESDLSFLHRLAKEEGVSLKVTDNQMVIFDQAMFEEKDPIATFTLGVDEIIDWSFGSQSSDLYKSCTCKYRIPKKRKTISYTWEDPDIEEGSNLKIRKCVANLDEAKRRARAALRQKNRYQMTGELTMVGDTRLVAGATIILKEFGKYSAKYLISKATHTLSNSGYIVRIELRRVLSGY
ncbi:TPA: late control D family protein [Klebsiella aerogenes]|nr:late control D family protein [Klebsiella aerogenes]